MRSVLVLALVVAAGCRSKADERAKGPPPTTTISIDAAPPPASPPSPPPPPADNHALAISICPQVTAPYLFRVEKGGHASFLMGTRHLGVGLDRMPAFVADDVAHAKLAVFEVAPGDDAATDDKPGPSLADAIGADAWAHYRALVGDDAAIAVEHEKPAIALILMMAAFEDPSASLDQDLEDLATAKHVPTRGLEKAAFQDALIDKLLDARALRGAIATTATRDDLRKDTVDDLGDYCRGQSMERDTRDEDDLRKAGYTDPEIAAYDDLILFSRNRAWIPQLEPIFDRGDAFVAVGLDHLLGDAGVIAALRKDGYQVTRVGP